MVKTALSVYLMFMALLVGLYFVAAPIIHGDTDEFPIWEVINYFMAIAVVIALAASLMHKRAMESLGRAVDVTQFLRINIAFYSALWLSLWFFWKWFETPLRWRRLRPLLGLDRPGLRNRHRSNRPAHMAEHRGHLAQRRSCGETFCRVGLFG